MSELTIHMPAKFKYEKQKMQDNFSMDLAERCQAEFTQAFNKFPNDTLKLSYTCDAIVNCYHGHHDLCHIFSFVCMKKCNATWLQRSPLLTKDFTIKSCDESLNLVRKCVEYRLGPAILERTKMNTITQKVEATNRSMRRSLPKHLTFCTFSGNFPGRAHSAAHNINNAPGESIYKLCKVDGSLIPSRTRVSRALYQEQKKTNSHKSRKKAKHYMEDRSKRRWAIYKLYAEHREVVKYQKNILLPVTPEKIRQDYTYTSVDKPKKAHKNTISVPKFKARSMVDVVWCTVSAVYNVSALGYFRAILG